MRYASPWYVETEGVMSVWIGRFTSADAFERYLEELYDDDEAPLSAFAADTQLGFYDHDFLEAEYYGPDDVDVETMLRPLSFSRSFLEAVVSRASELAMSGNAVLLLFDHDYTLPPDVNSKTVHFVGTFPYDPDSPPAGRLNG